MKSKDLVFIIIDNVRIDLDFRKWKVWKKIRNLYDHGTLHSDTNSDTFSLSFKEFLGIYENGAELNGKNQITTVLNDEGIGIGDKAGIESFRNADDISNRVLYSETRVEVRQLPQH